MYASDRSTRNGRFFWHLTSLTLAVTVALPLLAVFSGWLQAENAIWQHLAQTLLADLIYNTLVLLAGVAVGVLLLGVGLAWLTSMFEFPGRRLFDWALMLPLAVPAYVLAFVILGLFDFAGPVQGLYRQLSGAGSADFLQIRAAPTVITVMVLVLYPYVYMLARAAFLMQGRGTLEAARIAGLGPWGAFFRVALPMARPAIVAGTSLALMETLADFGTVAIFNYDTFTTAIYKVWFGMFNIQAASQLASLLLLFVALALFAERRLRGKGHHYESSRATRLQRRPLRGWRAWGAALLAALVCLFAFLLPLAQLLFWAWDYAADEFDERYLELMWHTLSLSALAACVTLVAAIALAFARRLQKDRITSSATTIATLGYALPGSVLAVGIMLSLTGLDNFLNALWTMLGEPPPGQLLAGSLGALILAYLVRFLAVAYGPLNSGLDCIRPHLAEAARSLGANTRQCISRVYLPLLRPGIMTALLLVLVDTMKEMPITLLLRPFGWDTLAVRIYELTSEGEWERAALPAITLVLVGLAPIILLLRRSARN